MGQVGRGYSRWTNTDTVVREREKSAAQPARGEHDCDRCRTVREQCEQVERRSTLMKQLVKRCGEIEEGGTRVVPSKAGVRPDQLRRVEGIQRAELERGGVTGEEHVWNSAPRKCQGAWCERQRGGEAQDNRRAAKVLC